MQASRTLRHGAALALAVFFLASCGGNGDNGDATPEIVAPTASARYVPTVPAAAIVTLDGSGSSSANGAPLAYSWALTSLPAGSSATLGNRSSVQASLTTDVVGTYQITLTVNDGVTAQTAAFPVVAIDAPTIFSDLGEPVSGVVKLSLSIDQGNSTVDWTADGGAIGSGATVSWDTSHLADGPHIVAAHVQSGANYALDVSRTFSVVQTPVSFSSATITASAGTFTAIVGARSVNGILRVDATLDGVAVGSLAAPNTCIDPVNAPCDLTGSNGYSIGGSIASGQHVVVVTATDGIGRTLGTLLRLNVP